MMPLPNRLRVDRVAGLGDGGTVVIGATDDRGRPHEVRLVAAAPWAAVDPPYVAGRLHFDGQALGVRSDAEAAVLELLRRARSGSAGVDDSIDRVIQTVESVEYAER